MPAESPPPPAAPAGAGRWWKWIEPAVGVVLFAVAAAVLHRELENVSYENVAGALRALPTWSEVLAVLFMMANYVVLTGFDLLAFVYIGKWIAPWRVMTASFVGYAISNNVGFTLLSGTSARYRFYSRWGLTPGDLSRVVVFYSGTYWVGILLLGGWVLAFDPHPALGQGVQALLFQALGGVLLLLALAYAVAPFVRRTPIRIRSFEIPIPPPRLVAGQFILSTADWFLAASIFYALLPPGSPGFGQVLGAFLVAQLLGLVSHVPGGLGVFEGSMLLMLGARIPAETLIGSLILFRIVYYLIPLVIALLILVGDEVRQRRHQVRRWGSAFGSLAFEVAPKVQALFVFGSGAVLLFSGALPTNAERMRQIAAVVPLPVIEVAHLAASVVGVLLLIASHGLGRRLRGTYRLTVAALGAGVACSLLIGANYEGAVFLLVVLAVLAPTARHFDRRISFWQSRFPPGWVLALGGVVAASVWLGFLVHRRVEFSGALWTEFALRADAARFVRASAGAALTLLAFGVLRRLNPPPPPAPRPSRAEIHEAARVVQRQGGLASLALLHDVSLLWSGDRSAFQPFGVHGRTWVAFGEPVGDATATARLIRDFVERSDDYNARPVFFLVSRERLHEYTDFGLSLVKLGDDLRVALDGSTAEWEPRCRRTLQPLEQAGISFRILDPADAAARHAELREVAEPLSGGRANGERGGGGKLEPAHLRRFRIAVLERDGRIDAWTPVWLDAKREEITLHAVRHREAAPYDATEALLHHLLLWAAPREYRWFSLGLEPLPGLEPLWRPLPQGNEDRRWRPDAALLARLLPPGLRYAREPRYMAYPFGLPMSDILDDVAALLRRGPSTPAARAPQDR